MELAKTVLRFDLDLSTIGEGLASPPMVSVKTQIPNRRDLCDPIGGGSLSGEEHDKEEREEAYEPPKALEGIWEAKNPNAYDDEDVGEGLGLV
ncbi:proton-coupled amino acid transporter 3-like [Pyrus ussuriensis x Pyrus communis]|uniref:Proton-coupled amino acid transporter 3-like n=1 Tax=Pyrus ussuriensis x Pyrus communis TaxID=2448454 RepID=A0A5N5FAP5_9ROSA|nr:proton-coupled amino acid transporter 3-like [Pyrus ussuriensis x Pyrus communis]